MNPTDSTGKLLRVGDRVRFRGKVYQIAGFRPGEGVAGTCAITFREPQHTTEVADEISVDLITAAEQQ